MDIKTMLSTVISPDSLKQISRSVNVPTKDVQSVLMSALPALLGGALDQANDQSTAAGFVGALNQHSASDTSNLSHFLGGVDLADGAKIIQHLLGGNTNTVAEEAAQKSGLDLGTTLKILAIAAPLLMSLLGKTAQSQQQAQTQSATLQPLQQSAQQSGGGLDISSLLGGLLKNVDIGKLLMSLLK